ncbi:hypothetical protein NQ317_003974 [Molorchus minor]|uniref:THAP-type domain-containing protein n=1 Tax=Molorchus minor TaxID=1323400 RepID=A0ABQ9JIM6_9CUCU|nr:hypothetical protein NQ317_003974 [Molorchus minor]
MYGVYNEFLFRIPSEYDNHKQFNKLASERRKAWINRLKRADLTESKIKNGRICSKHFISGKPSKLEDRTNPDWIPSLHMGYESSILNPTISKERCDRLNKRKKLREEREQANLELQSSSETSADNRDNDEMQTEDIIIQQQKRNRKIAKRDFGKR